MSAVAAGNGAAERRDDPTPEQMADLHLARRLFGYVLHHRGLFLLALLLYPVTAAAVVIPPYLVREILDVIIPARDGGRLQIYGALYLGAIALEYGSGLASQYAMSVLGERAMKSLREELFRHVLRLPARFYDKNPVGRILTRLTNDVDALSEVFATGAITVVGDLITVLSVVGMMFWLDVRLTLLSFLVVPPLIIVTLVFRVFARNAYRDIRKHLARINTFLAEHIAGMGVVQLFRQEERTSREFRALNQAYRDANRTAILSDALLYAVVEAIGTAAVAALLWFGAADLATGAVGAGTFIAFVQYIRRFFVPIRDLSTKYTVLQSAFAAAERVFLLLDEPVPIRSAEEPRRVQRLHGAVSLSDVWFSYRGAPEGAGVDAEDAWVLRGVDLQVRRGERVALVGATGSGKTTILKILNRTYDVQRGAVRVDGVDVRDLHLTDLRRLFAVVLQDVYLFGGTVMDNLGLGGRAGSDHELDPDAVRRAAQAVAADDFIRRLPQGYDTSVRELGTNFSAGERQLLAFARALARNPEVLVLDEATSSVDSETEARIQRALDVLLTDRTCIVVAHRLSTVRKMDRIVVLHRGEIIEEGDHESLMRLGGTYSRLAELQLATGST